MKTKLSALILLTISSCAASITVYPSTIQLTGRNVTQVVAVSSGERDVTPDCTFQIAAISIAMVSKEGLVTAAGDGKSSLAVACKGERAVVPVTVASAREQPKVSFVKD